MKKHLVVAGGLLVAGTGCNLFVNPPVKCDVNRLSAVSVTQTSTPARAGLPCLFADPYAFTVAYAPQVDKERSKADNSMLSGGAVKVVQGSAATRLCPGVQDVCANGGAPEISTTLGNDGSLSYQGLFSVDALGAVLGAGDSFVWEGLIASEVFGPGNSCPVLGKVSLTCQKPE